MHLLNYRYPSQQISKRYVFDDSLMSPQITGLSRFVASKISKSPFVNMCTILECNMTQLLGTAWKLAFTEVN
jgi:hypothetical protein